MMNDQPEIIVISLLRAVERREAIKAQFSHLGVDFHFFDAVDGKKGHELFLRFDARKAKRIGEIPLTAGHLGCYASHYLVWQRCSESNKPLIVLEDDAQIFEESFSRFLSVCPALPETIECVRLFDSRSRNTERLRVFDQNGVTVCKFLRGHKSATGYFLRPSAARKFLQYADTWAEPVDIEMDQFWDNGVECFGVEQACVTNNPEFESAIDTGFNTKDLRKGLMRLRWRWYLIKGKIRREIHNFKFRKSLNLGQKKS
ncbi:epitope biosynthesis protein [Marinobacter fuscus]|uniref:Epitope biosynthesis protein n=2 Tax=Marinobacter fuscus TaxID=2109942 RepID=A0A2T1K630_9GAMM|nr:epitope biosynthesis protein [Marinobacter fuscus]